MEEDREKKPDGIDLSSLKQNSPSSENTDNDAESNESASIDLNSLLEKSQNEESVEKGAEANESGEIDLSSLMQKSRNTPSTEQESDNADKGEKAVFGSLRRKSLSMSFGDSFGGIRASKVEESDALKALKDLSIDISHEIKLAEHLLQKEVITESQFHEAMKGLEKSASETASLSSISILMELEDCEHINMERIINFLVEETKVPFLNLRSFKIKHEFYSLLPPDIAERLGIIVFGSVGRGKQVALLNPRFKPIRTAIKDYLECNDVSFYFVSPSDITHCYNNFRAELAEANDV